MVPSDARFEKSGAENTLYKSPKKICPVLRVRPEKLIIPLYALIVSGIQIYKGGPLISKSRKDFHANLVAQLGVSLEVPFGEELIAGCCVGEGPAYVVTAGARIHARTATPMNLLNLKRVWRKVSARSASCIGDRFLPYRLDHREKEMP